MKHSSTEISSVVLKHFGMRLLSVFTLSLFVFFFGGYYKETGVLRQVLNLADSKSLLVQCEFTHTVQSEGKIKCMKVFALLFQH